MKKIWINRAKNFKEAERFDAAYYIKMTPEERLDIMEMLRNEYWKLKGKPNECKKRICKVVEVFKIHPDKV